MSRENVTRALMAWETADLLSVSANDDRDGNENASLVDSHEMLRKTAKRNWRREWESVKPFSKTPMDTGIFGATLPTSTT